MPPVPFYADPRAVQYSTQLLEEKPNRAKMSQKYPLQANMLSPRGPNGLLLSGFRKQNYINLSIG